MKRHATLSSLSSALTALLAAVLALLVAFGLDLSPEQLAAIAGVWAALVRVGTV